MKNERWDRYEDAAERGWQLAWLRDLVIGAAAFAGAAALGLAHGLKGAAIAAGAGALLNLAVGWLRRTGRI